MIIAFTQPAPMIIAFAYPTPMITTDLRQMSNAPLSEAAG
jgi:hypothetical protein